MKKILLLLIMIVMFSYVATSASPVFADALSDRLQEVQTATDETSFVQGIVRLAIPAAGIALLGLGSYGGFLLITSEGNPEKLGEAREVITNAVVGFGLIVLSVALLIIIQNVLNLPGVQN